MRADLLKFANIRTEIFANKLTEAPRAYSLSSGDLPGDRDHDREDAGHRVQHTVLL
jgi:hypothetical protein